MKHKQHGRRAFVDGAHPATTSGEVRTPPSSLYLSLCGSSRRGEVEVVPSAALADAWGGGRHAC
jgi:hypothetical protein